MSHNSYTDPADQNMNRENDKLEAGDITAASPALRWLDNFWYHNKWTVIVVAFFVTVGIICLVQFVSRPAYDTSVVMGSPYRMNSEERADFEALLARVCPKDFNDDGEKLVNFLIYQVYSEEEFESEADFYASVTNEEGETDVFQINRQYNVDEFKNFSQYTMTGETSVYILSPYMYASLADSDRLMPLSEIYKGEPLPAGAMDDGLGIRLSETDFYQYNPAAQVIPGNAILCLHRPTLGGRSKDPARYAEDTAFFRAIADLEVKE